jgi:hypothetical protein
MKKHRNVYTRRYLNTQEIIYKRPSASKYKPCVLCLAKPPKALDNKILCSDVMLFKLVSYFLEFSSIIQIKIENEYEVYPR